MGVGVASAGSSKMLATGAGAAAVAAVDASKMLPSMAGAGASAAAIPGISNTLGLAGDGLHNATGAQ